MIKNVCQKIVDHVAEHAAKKEILIGIDPRSVLGMDILRQNQEIMDLKKEVLELKNMVAEVINHQNNKC